MSQAAVAATPLVRRCRFFLTSFLKSHAHHHHLFTSSPYSSFVTSRSASEHRALRPLGVPAPGADDYDSGAAADDAKKSRNVLKREARRSVQWGTELSKFSPDQIKRVLKAASLEREVYDALMLVKKLGPDVREGKRRQFNYIGRLLRGAQPELMDALIQALKDGDNSSLCTLSSEHALSTEDDEEEDIIDDEEKGEEVLEVATRWFDGLICKDSSITSEVYAIHNVEFDRQELRRLVRRVRSIQEIQFVNGSKEQAYNELAKAKKPLLGFLQSLARKAYAE